MMLARNHSAVNQWHHQFWHGVDQLFRVNLVIYFYIPSLEKLDHLFTKSNQPTVFQTFSTWMIWMAIESKSSPSGRNVEALLVCIIVRMSLVSTLKDPPG